MTIIITFGADCMVTRLSASYPQLLRTVFLLFGWAQSHLLAVANLTFDMFCLKRVLECVY